GPFACPTRGWRSTTAPRWTWPAPAAPIRRACSPPFRPAPGSPWAGRSDARDRCSAHHLGRLHARGPARGPDRLGARVRTGAQAGLRARGRFRPRDRRAQVQRPDHCPVHARGTGRTAGGGRGQLPAQADRPPDVAGPCHRHPRRGRPGRHARAHPRGATRDAAAVSGFTRPAKKSLGQHFLHERGVVEKIILAVDPKPGDRLVEIGPGQGAMTFPLLDRHGRLTAIEFDRDLLEPLAAAARAHGELELIHSDVLDVDFTALAGGTPLRLVGNLPYNLSSPILFHALDPAAAIGDMHVMRQKEVVDRMAAGPGGKTYGRLSVMLQAWCEVTALFTVGPGAFRPPPRVDWAVVRLVPRPRASVGIADPAGFAAIVRDAFGQRRKTLRNALARCCDEAAIRAAGLDPQARAEQVPVAGFVRLANVAAAADPPG